MKTIEDKALLEAMYEVERANEEVDLRSGQCRSAITRRDKAIKQLGKIRKDEEGWRHEDEAPYGYCPHCGAKGVTREKRPDGDDVCAAGHKYPSKSAVAPTSPTRTGDSE